jgi:beta-galactosidase
MRKLLFFLSLICFGLQSQARERQNFDRGWLFCLNDSVTMSTNKYVDSSWRHLNLPHDWAIEADFSEKNPSGVGGGALPGGIGWYRKHFTVAKDEKYSRFFIDFDGVYMNSDVYLNGHLLGHRPYGYISFEYDMTPYIKRGDDNVIAVRVDNGDQPNSRWYSGCGIYRHVYLVKTQNVRVANWGTYICANKVSETDTKVNIRVELVTNDSKAIKTSVSNSLMDASGKVLERKDTTVVVAPSLSRTILYQQMNVVRPHLWSIDNPYQYKVLTVVRQSNRIVDTYTTPIGIRTFKFDPDYGFFLNGKSLKINGVCDHHDLGCLGAAVNEDALHRQLSILKNMGCNAIRCSHNPPAPELLNMADSMGFIVMDETFDIWRKNKTAHDYARYFNEWHERDVTDMVMRDRNHPSIMMWSIGNEVLEQWTSADADTLSLEQANVILNFGHDKSMLAKEGEMSVNSLLTRKLADLVRGLDPTRPITAGCNEPSPDNHLFRSGALDIIGYNYHNKNIPDVPKNFPGKPFIITESVSALQTRGYYRMPSDSTYVWPARWDISFSDPSFSCSSYDNCHVPWGSSHEETWDLVKHTPYVSGQFIWTGFDYLGEPTPYGWPARSSYFGLVDLAGFPKDSYYMYQSEWTDKPVLHLFPHWNWKVGELVDMWAYYNNADEVELFVNGKSQGVRSKTEHQYHVMWRVTFEPGEVKIVARKGGVMVGEQIIRTAGEPAKVRLTTDRNRLNADGKSLAFITAIVVDKDGNVCPDADNDISFTIVGEATIAGVDNGSETSMERFKDNHRKAFYGKCLMVLQSTDKAGSIKVVATGRGINGDTEQLWSEKLGEENKK